MICDDDELHYSSRNKFYKYLDEMDTYVTNNQHLIPNYGEKYRYGELFPLALLNQQLMK